jgi:hypothetical protein
MSCREGGWGGGSREPKILSKKEIIKSRSDEEENTARGGRPQRFVVWTSQTAHKLPDFLLFSSFIFISFFGCLSTWGFFYLFLFFKVEKFISAATSRLCTCVHRMKF